MNAQKRDLIRGRRAVERQEGVMLCADCDNEAAPFSCYCVQCEEREQAVIDAEERARFPRVLGEFRP